MRGAISSTGLRAAVTSLIAAVLALTCAALTLVGAGAAGAATRQPATPAGLPRAIEPLATYVAQTSCDQRTKYGTARLAHLLTSTYRTTAATTYACGTDGNPSEHYDGRAIDWMVDVHDPAQHAAAQAVLSWLLRTDAYGNRYAMARRLGIMYIIYDNRMWGAWSGQWEDYNGCSHRPAPAYDNSCHRTHMHISLGWNGATGHTTFWTKRVWATDYGPCRQDGMNWAFLYLQRNTTGCPAASRPKVAPGASALKRALVTYSGASVRSGWSGPAVTAVQRALHVAPSGHFGPATWQAVWRFQTNHPRCVRSGAMNISTWRVLLAVVH